MIDIIHVSYIFQYYVQYTLHILGQLQVHKWENAFTVDREAWTYRRNVNLNDFLSIEEILDELVSTVRYVFIQACSF